MRVQRYLDQIPGLHHLAHWNHPGYEEGICHSGVCDSKFGRVQSFLIFANFYRRLIKGFSNLAQPIISLTRKGAPFLWTLVAQNAFDSFRHAFITTSVLLHAKRTKPFQVETYASDFAIGAILSQADDHNLMHLMAYYSRKFTASEINYPIYNKELAAIIAVFEEWRPYLAGAQHCV